MKEPARELDRSTRQQPERRPRRSEKVNSGAAPARNLGQAEVEGTKERWNSNERISSVVPAGAVAMASRNTGLNAA
jgi:hypothetical protein